MTRQRFEGLRRELVRRLCEKYNQKPNYKELRDCRVDFTKTKLHSYKEAWESLKPARDLVEM